MSNITSLKLFKETKEAESEEFAYRAMILSMDKLDLLAEMVRFQEERSRRGSLSIGMMLQGKHLFKALEENAETQELRLLTRSYRRHLEYEIAAYLQTSNG